MFRRAIEEDVLDPARVIQAGMHGPLYGEADEPIPGTLGVETIRRRVLPRHRHTRGRRPDEVPGAELPARADRDR
jgi:hypothetical protein